MRTAKPSDTSVVVIFYCYACSMGLHCHRAKTLMLSSDRVVLHKKESWNVKNREKRKDHSGLRTAFGLTGWWFLCLLIQAGKT